MRSDAASRRKRVAVGVASRRHWSSAIAPATSAVARGHRTVVRARPAVERFGLRCRQRTGGRLSCLQLRAPGYALISIRALAVRGKRRLKGASARRWPSAPRYRMPRRRASSTSLLEVRDLHASYGGVRALRGVSLTVREGEIVAVLGNNGAGKSTLMRAISGTLALHGGAVDGGTIGFAGPRPGAAGSGRDRSRRRRAGAGGPADLRGPDGRGEPARGHVRPRRPPGRRRGARTRARPVPARWPSVAHQRGGAAVRRRAADAGHRPGADEPSRSCCCSTSRRWAWPRSSSTGSREVIQQINEQGTSVVLVEQNAAMALTIAHHAVGARGRPGRALRAGRRARRERRGARALPRHRRRGGRRARSPPTPISARRRPAQPRRRSRWRCEDVTVRFGGLDALERASRFTRRARHRRTRSSAPTAPASRRCSTCSPASTARAPAASRYGDADAHRRCGRRRSPRWAISRTFQNLALSPTATRAREPAARPSPAARGRASSPAACGCRARGERARRAGARRRRASPSSWGLGRRARRAGGLAALRRCASASSWRARCAPSRTLLLLDEPVAGMNADESRGDGARDRRSRARRWASRSSSSSTTCRS